MKKAAFLSVLLLLVLCLAESLSEPWWRTDYQFWDNAVKADYRSLGLIKKTTLPVYAAPGEDSYRSAKGKASVTLSEPITIFGETMDHVWQMIEYNVAKGGRRIGWIRLPESATKPDLEGLEVGATLGRMKTDAVLTDDPRGSGRALCKLSSGQEVAVLFEAYDSEKSLVYIKTEIDGKKAAGFVPEESCEPLHLYTIEGDAIVVRDGLEHLGNVSGWYYGEDGQWLGEDQAKVFGSLWLSLASIYGYDIETESNPLVDLTRVVLPETIRTIGTEAFAYITLDELSIPEGVTEIFASEAFNVTSIGTLHIPAGLTKLDYQKAFLYTEIGRIEVAEDNPVYLSRDGVLFSKDGKTLIAYPSGMKATHYDVPAGTEIIEASAFRNDSGALPLVTISLPIGLREIRDHAFSDCGELVSLVVPPTVKHLAENAFICCVSLQHLSLPAGLTASFDSEWVIREDFTRYNGDNGPTLLVPFPRDEWGRVIYR